MGISRTGLDSGENGDRGTSEEDVELIQSIRTRTRAMAVRTEEQHRERKRIMGKFDRAWGLARYGVPGGINKISLMILSFPT